MSEKPRDEMLDHEFDGIREFDNPPPAWIMNMLWASIVFATGYWLYYHTLGVGSLPGDRYKMAVAAAAEDQLKKMAGKEVTDQSMLLMAQIPERVNEGQVIFQQFCVPCHDQQGQGKVGPNLTDGFWLHGGKPTQILTTITKGVPEKGMLAWMDQLGPDRVQKVAAYVISIKGTNVPGKAPQGEPEPAAPAPGSTAPGAASPGTPAAPAASAPATGERVVQPTPTATPSPTEPTSTPAETVAKAGIH